MTDTMSEALGKLLGQAAFMVEDGRGLGEIDEEMKARGADGFQQVLLDAGTLLCSLSGEEVWRAERFFELQKEDRRVRGELEGGGLKPVSIGGAK